MAEGLIPSFSYKYPHSSPSASSIMGSIDKFESLLFTDFSEAELLTLMKAFPLVPKHVFFLQALDISEHSDQLKAFFGDIFLTVSIFMHL